MKDYHMQIFKIESSVKFNSVMFVPRSDEEEYLAFPFDNSDSTQISEIITYIHAHFT